MGNAKNDSDQVRLEIRDAMDRLLTGSSLHSDGKLTIKSLAAEADIKRWVLTHQHTDLQKEFRARCHSLGDTPINQKKLHEKYESVKQLAEKYKARNRDLAEVNHRLSRIVQVLTLENIKYQEKLDFLPGEIHYLR